MINNVISTVEGSDDIELKIIDNEEWEAVLYVGIDSAYRKFGDIEYNGTGVFSTPCLEVVV